MIKIYRQKKIKYLVMISLLMASGAAVSEVKIGDNPTSIDAASLLELESKTKAFVPPRMTTVEMNAMGEPLAGALVFNTDLNCLHQYIGSSEWQNLCNSDTNANQIGEITQGLQTGDADGWYLLDGRALTTLSASAQANAASLGLVDNLPDASGKFLKSKNNSSEQIAASGGQSSINIAQENLPDIDFTGTAEDAGEHSHSGTTNTTGSHSHTYSDRGSTTHSTVEGSSNPLADNTTGTYSTGSSGNHSHSLNISTAPSHSHNVTVNSGGNNVAINIEPSYLVVNTFIYLGL